MTGAPVRTALPFARSQLSSSRMLYARLHSKNALGLSAQGEQMSVVPPGFGKTRTLRRICACPVNGGPPPGLTDASAPVLRDDFSGGFGRTHTSRSLSWPLPTGYCFPSSQFGIFYFSIVYPGSIVKRQLSRRISFFSREMMRFSSREM